jgi:hypothetical protein
MSDEVGKRRIRRGVRFREDAPAGRRWTIAEELRYNLNPADPGKIQPPTSAAERPALQERLERDHGRHVDVLKDRWGWYARFFKKAPRREPRAQPGR